MMPRYLVYFSYIGTRFSGLQRQPNKITVQGVLEHALRCVLRIPDNVPMPMHSSSRTDAGVHAFMNTATFTLPSEEMIRATKQAAILQRQADEQRDQASVDHSPALVDPELPTEPTNGCPAISSVAKPIVTNKNLNPFQVPYDPSYLQAALNHILWDLVLDVRVTGVRVVHNGFCPRRHAKMRTYLYRLAVRRPEFDLTDEPALMRIPGAMTPLAENQRSWALGSNFNVMAMRDACRAFVGGHDFHSFMSQSNDDRKHDPGREPGGLPPGSISSTKRYIQHVGMEPGQILVDPKHDPLAACFDVYDVTVVGKSFLYNQVRRMVGALVAVAQGLITVQDIHWLLATPTPTSWKKFNLRMAPPYGLYLQNIAYDPNDFENPYPNFSHQLTPKEAAARDAQTKASHGEQQQGEQNC